MTEKSALVDDTPVPESEARWSEERDTLNDTPELRFLRDEIEALLAAPSVRRKGPVPVIHYRDEAASVAEHLATSASYEGDTEAGVDLGLAPEGRGAMEEVK